MSKINKIIPSVLQESWEIEENFYDACSNNDFKKIKKLLNSTNPLTRQTVYEDNLFNSPLEMCAKTGNLEMLRYLTNSPELLKHFEIKNADRLFTSACINGHIHVIDYLLNTTNIKFMTLPEGLYSQGVTIATEEGCLKTLKYFRNLRNYKQDTDKIEAENLFILYHCSQHNHLEIIKYLFKEPKIDNYKPNLRDLEESFKRALNNQHMDIIKYFIFDMEIPKTDNIKQLIRFLSIAERDKVDSFFKLRDVNAQLNEDLILNYKPTTSKKIKV